MNVVFDHAKEETDTIRTFYFRPDEALKFTAGQYVELTLPHKNPDNRGEKRWFTLSSSPSSELVSITTRFFKESGSSFKKQLLKIKPGDSFYMSNPMGDFVLPKIIQTPLIFVAGGIGITPFHSMLSWLIDSNESRPITLLYAVNSEDDIIFQESFDKAHQHATIIVNKPTPAWGGERGLLTAELIIGLGKPTEQSLVFISGPEPMVDSLELDLKEAGLKAQQIVTDGFLHYKAAY